MQLEKSIVHVKILKFCNTQSMYITERLDHNLRNARSAENFSPALQPLHEDRTHSTELIFKGRSMHTI